MVKKNEPRYLDSSAWIGYAGDVAAMLGRIPPPSGSIAISDHHHLAAFFLAEPDRIELGKAGTETWNVQPLLFLPKSNHLFFFCCFTATFDTGMKLDSSSEVFLALAGYDDNMDACEQTFQLSDLTMIYRQWPGT